MDGAKGYWSTRNPDPPVHKRWGMVRVPHSDGRDANGHFITKRGPKARARRLAKRAAKAAGVPLKAYLVQQLAG